MPAATTETPNADDLRAAFHERYGRGHDLEGATLVEIVIRIGSVLADIVGEEAAHHGMTAMAKALDYDIRDPAQWAESLRDQAFGDAYCWPMGVTFHDLNAFAYYGIALNGGRTAAEREDGLRAEIAAATTFMAQIPFEAWGLDPGDAGRTLRRARARFALDTGEPIEAEDLAALGGVSARRIRNMMAGKDRVFTPDDGRIPAAEALAWLAHRGEHFRTSRWRDQNTFEDLVPSSPELEDTVFVPVASDGSVFHAGLARDGTFAVGRGKRERRYATFEEALAALQKLADAAWPRPTPRGTWTTVSAARWVRMTRADLDGLAEAAGTVSPRSLS